MSEFRNASPFNLETLEPQKSTVDVDMSDLLSQTDGYIRHLQTVCSCGKTISTDPDGKEKTTIERVIKGCDKCQRGSTFSKKGHGRNKPRPGPNKSKPKKWFLWG